MALLFHIYPRLLRVGIWCHKTWLSFIQMMACNLFDAKPLHAPIFVVDQLDSKKQSTMEFWLLLYRPMWVLCHVQQPPREHKLHFQRTSGLLCVLWILINNTYCEYLLTLISYTTKFNKESWLQKLPRWCVTSSQVPPHVTSIKMMRMRRNGSGFQPDCMQLMEATITLHSRVSGLGSQIARFMGPTRGPPGSCRPQVGPMLAPRTLLSGNCRASTCWEIGRCFEVSKSGIRDLTGIL